MNLTEIIYTLRVGNVDLSFSSPFCNTKKTRCKYIYIFFQLLCFITSRISIKNLWNSAHIWYPRPRDWAKFEEALDVTCSNICRFSSILGFRGLTHRRMHPRRDKSLIKLWYRVDTVSQSVTRRRFRSVCLYALATLFTFLLRTWAQSISDGTSKESLQWIDECAVARPKRKKELLIHRLEIPHVSRFIERLTTLVKMIRTLKSYFYDSYRDTFANDADIKT